MKKIAVTLALFSGIGTCQAFTPDLAEIESAWLAQKYPDGSIQSPDTARRALADCEKIRAYSEKLSDYSLKRCNETFFVNRCCNQVRQARLRSEHILLDIEIQAKKVLNAEKIKEEKARQTSREARKARGPEDPFIGSSGAKPTGPDKSLAAHAKRRGEQTAERRLALKEKEQAEHAQELATQKRLQAHAKRVAEREAALKKRAQKQSK